MDNPVMVVVIGVAILAVGFVLRDVFGGGGKSGLKVGRSEPAEVMRHAVEAARDKFIEAKTLEVVTQLGVAMASPVKDLVLKQEPAKVETPKVEPAKA